MNHESFPNKCSIQQWLSIISTFHTDEAEIAAGICMKPSEPQNFYFA